MKTTSVTFYGFNGETKRPEVLGSIVWDGRRMRANGSDEVKRALDSPIYVSDRAAEKLRKITKSEPREFLDSLWLTYKSIYFNAAKPVESA